MGNGLWLVIAGEGTCGLPEDVAAVGAVSHADALILQALGEGIGIMRVGGLDVKAVEPGLPSPATTGTHTGQCRHGKEQDHDLESESFPQHLAHSAVS